MNLRRALRDRRHARWLAAARRGDGAAFRALYREMFPRVHGYLASRLAHREDVEDLTSHAFHRMLERLDRFDDTRGSVLGWVLTIAHHALVDHMRRARPRACGDALSELPAPQEDAPLERLLRAERDADLRAAIGTLEPETRRMIALRHDLDLSYREIASVLDVREEAVKQRFSRAYRRLRDRLARKEVSGHA